MKHRDKPPKRNESFVRNVQNFEEKTGGRKDTCFEVLFVVYGFELLVRVCPVSLVLVFVVAYLITCVSSLILVVTLYTSFCMYHLPKRHMMCVQH